MFKKVLISAAMAAILLFCCEVEAGTSEWTDCNDGEWGDPCNWWPIGVPNDNTFDVVINCPNGVEVRLTDNYTINKLDCYGQVDLESWDGWHRLTLNHADGLKNFGYLEIEEIGIIGNVTNWAMLELCDMDIEGDLNNLSGAWMGVEYETWVEGTLQNGGTIEIDLMSELVVEGVFWNYSSGTILIYGGECGADEQMLYNYGVIRGVGVLYGGQDVQNLDQGQIIASGGSLVVSCEGSLINTSTGLLRNEPLASLQIKPWLHRLHRLHTEPEDVNNYGDIEVNAGGGVAFDCNLVNEANGIIRLLGGTLAARNITHSAGAMLYGFGTITTNELLLESGTDPEFTGPTNIVGNLKVANGATLIISAGLTLITGHTTNNGTILLDGGSVIFEGGYSGYGETVHDTPPFASLAAHWQMDDEAANTLVEDSSGYGNDGTAQQITQDISTAGVVDGALSFDGTGDYIAIDGLTSHNDFTYVAWVKFDDLSGIQKIFDGGKFYIRLVVDGGGTHIDAYSSGLSDPYMRMFSFTPVTGRWYHFAYSYDSSSKKFYVDGSLEHQEPATGVMDAFTSMKLGTNSGATNNFFSGSMDNVSIFNETFTEAGIKEMYEEVAFLAGYWKLDDNAGDTVVKDSSYKGNDGTAQRLTNQISTTGKVGEALLFNGSSDYIAIDGLTTSYDDFTYAVWIKFDSLSGIQRILDGGKFYIRLVVDGGGTHMDAYSSGLSDPYMRMSSFTPVTGQWYHFAYSYDGSSKKFYVDGSLAHQESAIGVMDAFTSMKLGTNRWATNNFFSGSMDNVMIFNEALTDSQIQEVYNE